MREIDYHMSRCYKNHCENQSYALRRSRQNTRYTLRRDTMFFAISRNTCCSQNACFYADTEPKFCL